MWIFIIFVSFSYQSLFQALLIGQSLSINRRLSPPFFHQQYSLLPTPIRLGQVQEKDRRKAWLRRTSNQCFQNGLQAGGDGKCSIQRRTLGGEGKRSRDLGKCPRLEFLIDIFPEGVGGDACLEGVDIEGEDFVDGSYEGKLGGGGEGRPGCGE